ncbi:hypothetical protein F5146DRAFT_1140929 [Armillaria mellea]|nr:hypothetical protein F5146DRAFT_1140929 [Armillaria mellea]
MAQITRSAKSGTDWTTNELEAYNIVVQEQNENVFFGGPLSAYHGPADFIHHEYRTGILDSESALLLKRLNLAVDITEGEESAVDDLLLSYCVSWDVYAKTDVCLLDIESFVLLLVQEDKSHIKPMDPEAQLIAEAIAAFQENNKPRARLFLDPLPVQILPGITMVGTFPAFYKIAVTSELDRCIRHGQYPATQTIVYRHTPRVPRRRSGGMRPLPNRELLVRCYEAFKCIVLPDEDKANEENQSA